MQYKNVETDCYNFLCDLIKFHALNLNVESVRAFRDMGNDKKAFWNRLKRDFRFQWSRKLPRLENIWNLLLHCYFTKELKIIIVREICIQKRRNSSDFWAIYEWPWSWEFERTLLTINFQFNDLSKNLMMYMAVNIRANKSMYAFNNILTSQPYI